MACGEFDLIDRYFNRIHSTRRDVVVGSHFLPDISSFDLGYKSLSVNLSDLAAMGAVRPGCRWR